MGASCCYHNFLKLPFEHIPKLDILDESVHDFVGLFALQSAFHQLLYGLLIKDDSATAAEPVRWPTLRGGHLERS